MDDSGILRARLSADIGDAGQVTCRFLAPQVSVDEECESRPLDADGLTLLAEYQSDLEFLTELGDPPPAWLSSHRGKRKRAAEALAGIGLPQPIANAVTRLRSQLEAGTLLLEFSTNSPSLDCLPWELLGGAGQDESNLVICRRVSQEYYHPWPRS